MNKKAILGMLVAMVMSLGVMGAINGKKNDSNLTNLSALVWNESKYYTGVNQSVLQGTSIFTGGVGVEMGIAGAIVLASNPAGWVALGVGVLYLG